MKFVETHLSRHHLRHTPHRWVAALILSPIHQAELQYKRHYHLRFSHAKKLFVFDVLLLCSTVVLCASTIFWWLYDPTVTALVHLDVVASTEADRLQNGDTVTITITANNESDSPLLSPHLHVTLPAGFVITPEFPSASILSQQTLDIPLDPFSPHDDAPHIVTLSGTYYGTLGEHDPIQTMLIYTQEGRTSPESAIDHSYITAREPSLSVSVDAPTRLLPGHASPVQITLTNAQDHTLPPLILSPQSGDLLLSVSASPTSTIPSTTSPDIHIDALAAHETVVLDGTVTLLSGSTADDVSLSLRTDLIIGDHTITERTTDVATYSIAKPLASIEGTWTQTAVELGKRATLTLHITNSGNVPLVTPAISLNGAQTQLSVEMLAPGDTATVTLSPLVQQTALTTGDGPLFAPDLLFESHIPGVPEFTYTSPVSLDPLRVASTLSLSEFARYYTTEGDQLGRGPLPPQVGKETKYWIFAQLKNTVGTLHDATFTTTLAPGASWTGRSSVSRGGDITYVSQSKTATWYASRINPYETVGIYFEVAVTPDASLVGTIPVLSTQSTVSATDPFVGQDLRTTFGPVEASLSADPIGNKKGALVQN